MKRRWKILVLFFICSMTFFGCENEQTPELSLVTGVEITCRRGQEIMHRTYTQPGKVQRFLYYLRRQQTKGYARVDPERIVGDVYWVKVKLSDGRSRVYRQRANRFVSVDCCRWKNIDESWGRRLSYLLLLIPPDPVANQTAS